MISLLKMYPLVAFVLVFLLGGLGMVAYYALSSRPAAYDELDMMDDHRDAMRMNGDIDTAILYDDLTSG